MEYLVYIATLLLCAVGIHARIRSASSGESLDRRHEGWLLLLGLRISGLALAIAIYLAPPAEPGPLLWAGATGYALAVLWLVWMFLTLGRNLTDTVVTRRNSFLVTSGPYRYVRNPMYSGALAAGLSLALLYRSIPVAALTIVCFTQLAIRTRIEEKFLIARFGDPYVHYMRNIGRFWPHIR